MSDEMLRTPAAPGIDLEQFKDLIGFAAWNAINLPETDPRRDFIRQASELLALIDTSPKGGSDAAAWHGPDDLPEVSPGDMGWFWVAVQRANGMTYNFPASYLNAMLMSDEYGSADEPVVGNRYSHGAADEMEGSFTATGWHNAQEHGEYDGVYMPLLSDDDELVAWRSVENFTQQATSAEVGS